VRELSEVVDLRQRRRNDCLWLVGLAGLLLQPLDLGGKLLLPSRQFFENRGNRPILLRALRERHVPARALAIRSHAGEGGLPGTQTIFRPLSSLLALGNCSQPGFEPLSARRSEQALADAGEQEPCGLHALDVVMLALRPVTLVVQAAKIAKRIFVCLS